MQKLLLVSILIATVGLPLHAAKSPSAMVGLRRMVASLLAFEVFYVAALIFLYSRL